MTTTRTFEDRPAVRERVPLLLGLVGPSSSGKTYSALRLATGMQRVIGGEVFFIDTEAKRGTHYADLFKFRHVDFQPPFGPLDYLAAIEFCIKQGAKILVIDSMTHEHSGPGGVMDQSEKFLDDKAGSNWQKRQSMQMLSLSRPKQQRKKLNAAIVQLGINAIFCYRAQDKIKPVTGGEPLKLGWQPETTSTLHYDMTQRFLLPPGCEGIPSLAPETDAEKRMVKNPAQFRDFLKPAQPLSEEIGQKFAEWAAGKVAAAPPTAEAMASRYGACELRVVFDSLEAERGEHWKAWNDAGKKKVKAASVEALRRVEEAERLEAAGGTNPAGGKKDADLDQHGNPLPPGE